MRWLSLKMANYYTMLIPFSKQRWISIGKSTLTITPITLNEQHVGYPFLSILSPIGVPQVMQAK